MISQAPPLVSQAAPVISQAPPVSEQVRFAPPPPPLELVTQEAEVSRDGAVVSWGPPVGSSSVGSSAPQLPDYRNVFSWAGGPLSGLGTTPTYNGPQPSYPPPQQQWHLGQGSSQGQYQQYPPQPPQYPQYPPPPSSLPAAAGGPPPPPAVSGDISLMFQTLAVTQNAQESYIRQLQAREQETLANQLVFKRKFKEEMRAADLLHDTEKV